MIKTQREQTLRTKLTPPEVAKRFGVSPDKVRGWIRNGELRAIDVAGRRGGRPRYLIDEEDLRKFESRREIIISPPNSARKKRPNTEGVIEFF